MSIVDKESTTTQDALKKFKEEKTKRDWEIVAFGGKNFNEAQINAIKVDQFVHGRLGGIDTELGLKLGCPIHSVKRLSDGEVFSVGDEVENEAGRYCGIIDSILIGLSGMLIFNTKIDDLHKASVYGIKNIQQKTTKPKALFVTEDGVEVFKGDRVWYIDKYFGKNFYDFIGNLDHYPSKYKYFSTEEKAEEYILNNKPLLSVNDVQNVLNGQINRPVGIPFIESIKELAKQKLSK